MIEPRCLVCHLKTKEAALSLGGNFDALMLIMLRQREKLKKSQKNVLLKLPMKAIPTESWLLPLACAPTTPQPRPSNTVPSPPTRKLKHTETDVDDPPALKPLV